MNITTTVACAIFTSLFVSGCVATTATTPADAQAKSGETLSAPESTPAVPPVNPIDELIGKRLVSDDGDVFSIGADGTMGGSIRGEDIIGVYTRSGNEICSTYSSPEFLTGRKFCSIPDIKKGSVVFNRQDGSKSPKYKIQG